MKYLKVGCNFSNEFIDILDSINSNHTYTKVNEIYGSTSELSFLTARPLYRLPNVSRNEFREYVKRAKSKMIDFNYTLNANYIGDGKRILSEKKKIQEFISFLIDCGVSIITVSIPLIAELVRDIDEDIGIEVSTIAHIDTITQIRIWNERYNIVKVCGNLIKNREIGFLTSAAQYCNKNDIKYSIIVNEFCGNGSLYDKSSATGCIYRDSCYMLHSINYNSSETDVNNGYPMARCIESRNSTCIWLKMNFIRPEDLNLYNNIGINNFKVTGRTGSLNYLEKVITAYANGSWDGNVLELWKHLETIKSKDAYEYKPEYYIENKKLNGFLNYWFNNPNHKCSEEVCGETCCYCDNFLAELD